MEIKVRNFRAWPNKYKEVVITDGSTTFDLGLLNKDEVAKLVTEFDGAIYALDGSRYCKETSEKIQENIITCVDGILEGEKLPPEVVERLKEELCQIIVDNRKQTS